MKYSWIAGLSLVVLLCGDEVEGKGPRQEQERQVLIASAKQLMPLVAELERLDRQLKELSSTESWAERKALKAKLNQMQAHVPSNFRQCLVRLKTGFRRQPACEKAWFGTPKERRDPINREFCELAILGVLSKCYTDGLFDAKTKK